jgi:hypothetical protein
VGSLLAEGLGQCVAEPVVVCFELPDALGGELQALAERGVGGALRVGHRSSGWTWSAAEAFDPGA